MYIFHICSMSISKPTKSAIFKILVLGIVYKTEIYGYGIIKQIGKLSDGDIEMKEGTLYPLLKKLHADNLQNGKARLVEKQENIIRLQKEEK